MKKKVLNSKDSSEVSTEDNKWSIRRNLREIRDMSKFLSDAGYFINNTIIHFDDNDKVVVEVQEGADEKKIQSIKDTYGLNALIPKNEYEWGMFIEKFIAMMWLLKNGEDLLSTKW